MYILCNSTSSLYLTYKEQQERQILINHIVNGNVINQSQYPLAKIVEKHLRIMFKPAKEIERAELTSPNLN